MEATKIRMEEHRVIERAITAIEGAARRLDSDPSIRAGFFLDAAAFDGRDPGRAIRFEAP